MLIGKSFRSLDYRSPAEPGLVIHIMVREAGRIPDICYR
jgi:hypothetical protein